MAGDLIYLRKRISALRGEANGARALIGLRGEHWAEKRRVVAELRQLEAAADELQAELEGRARATEERGSAPANLPLSLPERRDPTLENANIHGAKPENSPYWRRCL